MSVYITQRFKFKDCPDDWTEDDSVKGFDLLHSYDLYGFLADIRNYCKIPTIVEPRGKPIDFIADEWFLYGEYFGFTYFSLQELLDFDYEKTFEYRRRSIANGITDRHTVPEGEGTIKTIRECLGDYYFNALKEFQEKDVTDIMVYFS